MQTALGVIAVYQLTEAGLSNVLALKSYENGTNPIDNVMLRIFGGNIGQINKCYFRNDSFLLATKPEVENDEGVRKFLYPIIKRVVVRFYAPSSTYKMLSKNQSPFVKVFILLASLPLCVLPPLRIKFTAKPFDASPDTAVSYLQEVKPNQIGLLGLFQTGITQDTPKRIMNNQRQVSVGLVQLGCALLLVCVLFDRFIASPRTSIAALILA
jgi:hypothetical protein